MNVDDLKKTLELHSKWLRNEPDGERADLHDANLHDADLEGADLEGADLRSADLYGANLPDFALCPEEGDFIAWKRVRGAILKLRIVGKRTSSLVGRKCRTDRAVVLEALNTDQGTLYSLHDSRFAYTVGAVVVEPEYDDDIRVECTKGIHFFMTRKEAENYS